MKKVFILLVMTLIVSFICAQDSYGWTPDDIIGYWESDNGAWSIKIEKSQDSDAYILYEQKSTKNTNIGEVSGEVFFRNTDAAWNYTGRHTFFGSKHKSYRWGEDGGLAMQIIDYNTMHMAWLDVTWDGRWTLRRR